MGLQATAAMMMRGERARTRMVKMMRRMKTMNAVKTA